MIMYTCIYVCVYGWIEGTRKNRPKTEIEEGGKGGLADNAGMEGV